MNLVGAFSTAVQQLSAPDPDLIAVVAPILRLPRPKLLSDPICWRSRSLPVRFQNFPFESAKFPAQHKAAPIAESIVAPHSPYPRRPDTTRAYTITLRNRRSILRFADWPQSPAAAGPPLWACLQFPHTPPKLDRARQRPACSVPAMVAEWLAPLSFVLR